MMTMNTQSHPLHVSRLALAVALSLSATAVSAAEPPADIEQIIIEGQRHNSSSHLQSINASDVRKLSAATSDTASLLSMLAGVSVNQTGAVSSLPMIRGLSDDRLRIKVDGMDMIAACPNHMNPPLSYMAPSDVGQMTVFAGITPVSVGGDSIGGTVISESRAPEFSDSTRFEGEAGGFSRSNNSASGMNVRVNRTSEKLFATAIRVGKQRVIEAQIIKSKDTLSIEQLSKILLSFTMNRRQIKDDFWKEFLNSTLNKIDKASSKDTFYLAMALGRGKINPALINSDLYYTLYLNTAKHTINDEFDLYQLSQLSMFMCNPHASPYVPDDFWKETLESAMNQAIINFKKYEGKINKEVYLDDLIRSLVSFGIRGIASQ
jgi:hypothetical protein